MNHPEYKTYTLKKFPIFGFGIEISGGTDQIVADESGTIKISDVLAVGPASSKLQIGDKLIMVQNNSCVGMTHADCINLIKNAGDTISVSIERHIESIHAEYFLKPLKSDNQKIFSDQI